MIEYLFTPEEAQTTASAIVGHYRREKYKVSVEAAVADDLRLRPTVTAESVAAENKGLRILVEAQGKPKYSEELKELLRWATANRKLYGQIYIATSINSEIGGTLLTSIQRDGIGLLLVDNQGNIIVSQEARNPALTVWPDPTLKLGRCKNEVEEEVERFNNGQRKAALQQICEIVERETDALARRAAKKGWLTHTEAAVSSMKWANQLDVLAANKNYVAGYSSPIDNSLKNDLDSFRDVRNLIDHKVRTKKAERNRQIQFGERMMTGPRLIEGLLVIQRKIR